ncbi:hypothetical protein L1I30_06175 [Gillisia sp. M10.2A]|uniref:DUF3857 domain-containing protein n=1 Tax=Gillisia lutea TaxID=2909668 RepID=A0ABS9EGI4_9FLAO|nr:hypothetical protein [Gillisia lutea]MCF4101244.1 hypothetical protein [Gillisia lutea]
MRYIILIFILLFGFNMFSQDTSAVNGISKTYINIKTYKEKGETLTKQDSLNFMIEGKDTLVLVTQEFIKQLRKGNGKEVRVKYEPKDSTFLETYKNIVFGKKDNSKSTLKIWKDKIRIYFDASVPKKHTIALMDFAEGLSAAVDSLNIKQVDTREESNYLVYYINNENDEDFEPRINNENSGYYVSWNGKQQLTQASLKVNTLNIKSGTYQIAHLKFNFFRTLGYFGDNVSLTCQSYLSKCPVIRSLTPIDMEVLKYHYTYGICKGTNREDFEAIHTNMKKTLKTHPNAQLFIVHTL